MTSKTYSNNLYLVTKEDHEYSSQMFGIFSNFDKAKSQLNIKCNEYHMNNKLKKVMDGIWITYNDSASLYFKITKVKLDSRL